TQAIAASAFGATVDVEGFDALRLAASQAQEKPSTIDDDGSDAGSLASSSLVPTAFVGYDTMAVSDATVLHAAAVVAASKKSTPLVAVALTPCPFYAEGGGQVGDRGVLTTTDGRRLEVVNTVRAGPETIHVHVVVPAGTAPDVLAAHLAAHPTVAAAVDTDVRSRVAAHHSATHLLQAALKETLGAHVTQCGSYVGADRLRFDFSHFGAMTQAELHAIEARVNQIALENVAVRVDEMEKAAAQASGAVAAFGEKYGDVVRVVRMGSTSSEFCGGTHVASSAALFPFVLLSEASVAAGTRRIEAVAGIEGVKRLQEKTQLLDAIADQLHTVAAMVPQKLTRLETQLKASESYIQAMTDRLVSGPIAPLREGHLHTGVAVHVHDMDLPAASSKHATDNKVLGNMYMTALRRRAEHVAKAAPDAVHVVVMGENIIFMGNKHVHAGEALKQVLADAGLGHGGGSNVWGQGKLRPGATLDALVAATCGTELS
ncbi:hypothetical protein As57867_019275, partial [Aphanomyces stellatus]